MSEPLKGKKGMCTEYPQDCWITDDIKSAFEWMIQKHEEKIELLIEKLIIWQPTSIYTDENNDTYPYNWIFLVKQIKDEYESIMILEEGLSDIE